jgi:hypothetical protein
MDELDAFECEVDNAKEALASKLAVISFMECEARIDNWLDRELMLRLTLVSEEGKDEVVEGSDDGGGVNSKLAVISLPFIKVDANVDIEVFVTKREKGYAASTLISLKYSKTYSMLIVE